MHSTEQINLLVVPFCYFTITCGLVRSVVEEEVVVIVRVVKAVAAVVNCQYTKFIHTELLLTEVLSHLLQGLRYLTTLVI